jgi:hypothetical protein
VNGLGSSHEATHYLVGYQTDFYRNAATCSTVISLRTTALPYPTASAQVTIATELRVVAAREPHRSPFMFHRSPQAVCKHSHQDKTRETMTTCCGLKFFGLSETHNFVDRTGQEHVRHSSFAQSSSPSPSSSHSSSSISIACSASSANL